MSLTHAELEARAADFREKVGIAPDEPLDPFQLTITGIKVITLNEITSIPEATLSYLTTTGARQWSAMSIPVDTSQDRWIIVLNFSHELSRQRVSLLEEIWHILEGHELTAIARVGDCYGRTYSAEEEHDAYYLAGATLVPAEGLKEMVAARASSDEIAKWYGASRELVEYRIKRIGLWAEFKGKHIRLVTAS